MNPILRNVFAVIIGVVIGSVINSLIIIISGLVIPPPAGADVTTMEGLKESLHLFEPKHFLMPFLAHALGTLVGGLIAAIIATSHKLIFSAWHRSVFLNGRNHQCNDASCAHVV